MEGEEVAFITSFLLCAFEGFEMSMFSYLASSRNKKMGDLGTIAGVFTVIVLVYITYLILPVLLSDMGEYALKMFLGFLCLGIATLFLYKEYPEGKGTAFFTAFIGVVAEGIEVDLFQVSAYLMTGYLIPALLGGILGFTLVLFISKIVYFKFPIKWMKRTAIAILYIVGFVTLTSGIV